MGESSSAPRPRERNNAQDKISSDALESSEAFSAISTSAESLVNSIIVETDELVYGEAAELWTFVFRGRTFETARRKRHAELTNRYISDENFRNRVLDAYQKLTGRLFLEDYREYQRRREEELRARTLQPYVDEAVEMLKEISNSRSRLIRQITGRRRFENVKERYHADRHFRHLLEKSYNANTRHSLKADFPEFWRAGTTSRRASAWRSIFRLLPFSNDNHPEAFTKNASGEGLEDE